VGKVVSEPVLEEASLGHSKIWQKIVTSVINKAKDGLQ
jgi:hypothetical protein